MIQRFYLTFLLAAALPSYSQAELTPTKVIKVGTKPESICKAFGGKLYISIINGMEPGDGEIAVLDQDKVSTFATGLDDPKGLDFINNQIIVSDRTKIWSIDQNGEKKLLVDKDDFPREITFLNDIVASPDGKHVYVTDMSPPTWMFDPEKERVLWPLDSPEAIAPMTGCVYKVSLDGKVIPSVPPGNLSMPGPNGVTALRYRGKDALVMGDFFTGNIIAWDGTHFETIATGFRGADAVSIQNDVLYVSSWPLGKVWAHDLITQTTQEMSADFTTAADFYHDRENNQLIVPDMLEGTVKFLPIPSLARPASAVATKQTNTTSQQDHVVPLQKAKESGANILLIGDSAISSWKETNTQQWKDTYSSYKVAHLELPNDQTQHTLWRLQNSELKGISPETVILHIGLENLKNNHSPEDTATGIQAILSELSWKLPTSHILILPLTAALTDNDTALAERVEKTNQILSQKKFPESISYLTEATAQKNTSIYEAWKKAITPHLKAKLNTNEEN